MCYLSLLASARLRRFVAARLQGIRRRASASLERFLVDNDELAIYVWINPTKPPVEVKRERHRMVLLQAIRYGIQNQAEDIWQEWQLAVHQRVLSEPPVRAEEREFFTFGIARNLCRSLARKEHRTIHIADSATPAGESAGSVREPELNARRADRPAEPVNKYPEPEFASRMSEGNDLRDCISGFRPAAQEILRKTYTDGKSSFEVARETGLSADNVRQQLRRLRDDLRRCLALRSRRDGRKESKHASSGR
jgi:RNA polymerase sigma factor (sigma-70 family)